MGNITDTIGEYATASQNALPILEEINTLGKNIDSNWKSVNIIIMGQTGVGKSTLVNAMLGKEVARTGIGSPVTNGSQMYKKYTGNGYTIYDTDGLELDENQQERLAHNLCELIRTQNQKGLSDSIHVIWYCIAASCVRLQDRELTLLKKVVGAIKSTSFNVPVIFPITKPSIDPEDYSVFYSNISEQVKPLFSGAENRIIPVNAKSSVIGYGPTVIKIPIYGLVELSEKVKELLPNALHDSWIRLCTAELENKRKLANKTLATDAAAVAAIAAAATATGLDDSTALIAAEVHLFAKIGSIYNFKVNIHQTTAVVLGGIGTVIAASTGKTIFSWILAASTGGLSKLVEGGIRITIAESLIITLGTSFIALMEKFAKGEISESEVTKKMEDLLINHNKKK